MQLTITSTVQLPVYIALSLIVPSANLMESVTLVRTFSIKLVVLHVYGVLLLIALNVPQQMSVKNAPPIIIGWIRPHVSNVLSTSANSV